MCIRCELSRRSLLAGGAAAAASLTTGVAQARVRPQDMAPLVGPGFRPADQDEAESNTHQACDDEPRPGSSGLARSGCGEHLEHAERDRPDRDDHHQRDRGDVRVGDRDDTCRDVDQRDQDPCVGGSGPKPGERPDLWVPETMHTAPDLLLRR